MGNFIAQRQTNVSSYFNTYYNSEKMFSEAEAEVLAGLQTAREKAAKGQTVPYVLSSTARQKFTNSIEKNSKLLSYYPTSKYVDDALLMIGKSYFYLEEDVKAERKFLELISQYPESGLISEAKLWYGRSLLRQKRFAEGLQLLGGLYIDAIKTKDYNVAGRAALITAEYYFGQGDYDNALQYYTQSVESLRDDEENARTQFQIGICYTKLGKTDEAEDAFHDVTKFSPDYNTAFQAAVYESRMMTLAKKYDPALENLFAKLDDAKYTEYFGTAHREVGDTYAAQGNITEAVAQYRYVDTAFARTDDAARSMFALASLYEHTLFRFDSARTYYDKAKVEFSASEITPDATMKSDAFGKYFNLKRDIANYDTLIMDVWHPRPLKMDSASVARRDSVHRADSLAAVKKNPFRTDNTLGARSDTSATKADSVLGRFPGGGPAGMAQRDSLPPALPPVVLSKAAQDSMKRADSLATLIAKTKIVDSLSRQIVRMKFEMAGLFYLELSRPDSALAYYQDVVHLTKDSLLAARAYYTMAQIYTSSDSLSRPRVDSIYRNIIDVAPRSSYAQEARKSLGLPLLKEEQDSAEVQFLAAERTMIDGKTKDAILSFRSLAAAFPKSPFAPKALYTVGWIFENTLIQNDSAEAVYSRLVEKYPSTPYSSGVQAKLAEIVTARKEAEAKAKAEKDAAEKAEADRLKAIADKEAKAKADKEAKAKAEAEKLKASAPAQAAAAPRDSVTVPPSPDSTGARTDSTRIQRGMPGRRLMRPPGMQQDTTQKSTLPPG